MRILTVSYKELRGFGNYQNCEVGAVAEVAPDETPEVAYAALRGWVMGQLDAQEREEVERNEVDNLEYRKAELERGIAALERRYGQAAAFLGRVGIPVPDSWGRDVDGDGLPF